MSVSSEKLSAFLDGELPAEEARSIEQEIAVNPKVQAELEALMAADTVAQTEFADQLAEPVPDALLTAVQEAPEGPLPQQAMPSITLPDNQPSPVRRSNGLRIWMMAAAASVALVAGGLGGYVAGLNSSSQQIASVPAWLTDVADYHGVYASQNRHLVEVDASEADHIQTWLTGTLGAPVSIPDLSDHGLEFQGARLLVAAGKPVAQLMYRDEAGSIVALCQIQSASPAEDITRQTIAGFDMIAWGGVDSNFVIVGDEGNTTLSAVAQTAAGQV